MDFTASERHRQYVHEAHQAMHFFNEMVNGIPFPKGKVTDGLRMFFRVEGTLDWDQVSLYTRTVHLQTGRYRYQLSVFISIPVPMDFPADSAKPGTSIYVQNIGEPGHPEQRVRILQDNPHLLPPDPDLTWELISARSDTQVTARLCCIAGRLDEAEAPDQQGLKPAKLGEPQPLTGYLIDGDLSWQTWTRIMETIVGRELRELPKLDTADSENEAMPSKEKSELQGRPPWPYSFPMRDVKFFESPVKKVEADILWKSSSEWEHMIRLTNERGHLLVLKPHEPGDTITRRLVWFPDAHFGTQVCDIPQEDSVWRYLRAIEKFDQEHEKEWAEYQRLKILFEDQQGDLEDRNDVDEE